MPCPGPSDINPLASLVTSLLLFLFCFFVFFPGLLDHFPLLILARPYPSQKKQCIEKKAAIKTVTVERCKNCNSYNCTDVGLQKNCLSLQILTSHSLTTNKESSNKKYKTLTEMSQEMLKQLKAKTSTAARTAPNCK